MLAHRHGTPRKRRWLVTAPLAALAAVAIAPTAQAGVPGYQERVIGGHPPDMFTTNVPYVAWRGEQVRAVKCDDSLRDGDGNLRDSASVDVLVESWSGPGRDPQVEAGTVDSLFWSSDHKPCVRFDMVSSDAGLARVKLVVSDEGNVPIVKHQFLFIWLSLGNVAIDEVGANDPTGAQPAGSQAAVGDPAGDGNFNASSRPGRVQVQVTGTFPHPLAPGGTFTLPRDWPTLANALATDNNSYNDPDADRWDIHDDQAAGDRHIIGGFCPPTSWNSSTNDDVDNCRVDLGSSELGPFSNVFRSGVQAGGPFDPARPATLLSNGTLDSGDAPMPATRVDVEIAPNSGAAGDISGVGTLTKVDKGDVYSRDGNGTIAPHNLFAPYYDQWIPATAVTGAGYPEGSGIDGPQKGNNFEGFLVGGLYDNWSTTELRRALDGPTSCNKYVDFRYSQVDGRGPYDVPRLKPYGPQRVAVYTDEHGEAQVAFNPNRGFYWDGLPGAIRNDNRGCDLQGVDVLGTAAITATARYPYQPVDDGPRVSATIHKTVHNEFDKSLSYWPKGPGAANENARIVVVHANDIDGRPFSHETVCFYIDDEADGYRGFAGETGPAGHRIRIDDGFSPVPVGDICRTLDQNGNAAIEVFNSDPQNVNVIAEFADEGLLRDIDVQFGTPGSSGGTPPSGGNPCPVSLNGCGAPTPAQIVATAGAKSGAALIGATTKAKPRARHLAVARLSRTSGGKRVLVVRVTSPRRTERISVRARKLRAKRTVRTNRLVRVKHLKLPAKGKVTVRLAR
ncbi:MAG: hypothetical protein LT070_04650 [Solirubrobacteraceae bacterium]|nr:hypothetical protein [Solirubrobacteraceae bacterium]